MVVDQRWVGDPSVKATDQYSMRVEESDRDGVLVQWHMYYGAVYVHASTEASVVYFPPIPSSLNASIHWYEKEYFIYKIFLKTFCKLLHTITTHEYTKHINF